MTDSKTPFFDAVEDIGNRRAAARAMLAALKEAVERPRHSMEDADWWGRVYAAIAQAEAAGIGEDDQP